MNKVFTYVLAGMAGGMVVLLFQFGLNHQVAKEKEGAYLRQVNQINVSPSRNLAIPSFIEAAEKARPGVVHIAAFKGRDGNHKDEEDEIFDFFLNDEYFSNPFRNRRPSGGSASGVIYTNDGYIITNKHVIDLANRIEVTLLDNRQFEAEVVGIDSPSDLAVLKIDAFDLPVLEVGNSAQAKVGEWVLAVGNPFDLSSTVTAGIISAKGRNINLLKEDSSIETFIQTDAAVNPGNSGGALIDSDGKLLGINTAIATNNGVFSGYSFAIPSNLVTRVVSDIIEYGAYQRGYLGVHIYELDDERAEELGVNIAQGVVIEEVIAGGAAEDAHLAINDIIIAVDGRKVRGIPDLQEIVGTARVGDKLMLTIRRGEDKFKIPIILKSES